MKKIEGIASKLLMDLGIDTLPIPIEEIAQNIGLKVEYHDMGHDTISGLLFIDNGIGTIGINKDHSQGRQRFTVAHELGHFILHRFKGDLFIDEKYKVHFRDMVSSTGEIQEEREANAFAAAILMPRYEVINKIERYHIDIADDQAIKNLADIFCVSQTAMTIRISNLNLF